MKKILLLLPLLILIVVLDLATGIFYWNRLNLVFNASNFNNIVSPLVGLTALIVNALVLILFLKQTKIIQSQNLKPFFIDRITRIEQESNAVTISNYVNGKKHKIQGFDKIISLYIKIIKALKDRTDYHRFIINVKKNIQESSAESLAFYKLLYPLIYTTVSSSEICLFTKKIGRLIETIEASNLLNDDKQYLLGQINSEVLSNYNSLLEIINLNSIDNFYYALPCIYDDSVGEIVPIINILDTEFIIDK